MGIRLFSDKNRPVHMGRYPSELLARTRTLPDLAQVPAFVPLSFDRSDRPHCIVNAMREHQAMLDGLLRGLLDLDAVVKSRLHSVS